jgi:hypothetical protein
MNGMKIELMLSILNLICMSIDFSFFSDFNRTHGRPVTKSEDILPVANEYQRYKVRFASLRTWKGMFNHKSIYHQELKNLIKDLKG